MSDTVDPYEDLTLEQVAKLGDDDPTDPFIRSRLGLPPLTNVLALSTTAAIEASGISNLPGGIKTIGSLVNNATDAENKLPNTSDVKSIVNNVTTAATNGISMNSISSALKTANQISGSMPSVIGDTTNVANQISGISSSFPPATEKLGRSMSNPLVNTNLLEDSLSGVFDKLKSGASTLTELASTGLPPGLSAQLNTAIASLSSGGPVTVKMPTIAINTNDRSSLTAAVASLLPRGVPAPNFNAPSAASVSAEKSLQDRLDLQTKQLIDLETELTKLDEEFNKAVATISELKQFLPPGDPAIEQANTELDTILNKIKNVIAQKDAITTSLV